jgi:hypothetical protein
MAIALPMKAVLLLDEPLPWVPTVWPRTLPVLNVELLEHRSLKWPRTSAEPRFRSCCSRQDMPFIRPLILKGGFDARFYAGRILVQSVDETPAALERSSPSLR